MLKHSRTVAAIAASSLLAAFVAQANKGAEYKPHHHKHEGPKFFITGGATYLEPSFNGLDYATLVNSPDATTTDVYFTTYTIEPEFNWGYYIAAGYKISHHYDIQASWAQYNSSLSDATSIEGTGVGGPDPVYTELVTSNQFNFDPALGETAYANSKQTINYSVFDATLGQYHDITEMLKARVFAGVRWAKVDATTENTYEAPFNKLAIGFDNYNSTFNGAGPEVGLDLEYKVWEKLGVVGHFAAAFLIGQQETDSYLLNTDFSATSQISVDTDSVARVVPALDTKLGLNWEIPYQHDRFAFAVEAGYQVAYYFDVIDQVQVYNNQDNIVHNFANYGNMGPYLNLTAMF